MKTAIVILFVVACVAHATDKTTPELPTPVAVAETEKKLEKRYTGFAYSGPHDPATFARLLKVAAAAPPVPHGAAPSLPSYGTAPFASGYSSPFMDTSNNASSPQYLGAPTLSYDQYRRPMGYGGAAPTMPFDRFASSMGYGGAAPMQYDRVTSPMVYGGAAFDRFRTPMGYGAGHDVSYDRYRSLLGLAPAPAPRPSYAVYY